jgi:hypothetical protein
MAVWLGLTLTHSSVAAAAWAWAAFEPLAALLLLLLAAELALGDEDGCVDGSAWHWELVVAPVQADVATAAAGNSPMTLPLRSTVPSTRPDVMRRSPVAMDQSAR